MARNCKDCEEVGLEIDRLIEQREDAIREVGLLKKFIEGYKDQRSSLVSMLRSATVRLEICLGRMRACDQDGDDFTSHEVSLFEIPAWMEEQTELVDTIDMPSAQDIDRRCLALLLDSKVSRAFKERAQKVYEERYGSEKATTADAAVLDRSRTRSA
jgi:hypothetical protein